MNDAVGKPITVGDKVAYIGPSRGRRHLKTGFVLRVHEKMVGVGPTPEYTYPFTIYPNAVVVIE